MAVIVDYRPPGALHPLHAVFLAGALPLFAGALLSDIAYARSYEIQWNNFASWLIAGGLVLSRGQLAGLWFLRATARRVKSGAARQVDLTFRARIDLN